MGECWNSDCGKVGVYKGLLGILWGGLPFDIRGVTSILRCLRVSFQFLFSFQSEFKSFRTKSDLVI